MAKATIRNFVMWTVILLLASGLVWAHGGEKHIMGTVKDISADSISIETTVSATVVVGFTAQTRFIRDGKTSSVGELKTGSRVVIHAKEEHGKLIATEMKSGAMPAATRKK